MTQLYRDLRNSVKDSCYTAR